jgi:hypothetical protein
MVIHQLKLLPSSFRTQMGSGMYLGIVVRTYTVHKVYLYFCFLCQVKAARAMRSPTTGGVPTVRRKYVFCEEKSVCGASYVEQRTLMLLDHTASLPVIITLNRLTISTCHRL